MCVTKLPTFPSYNCITPVVAFAAATASFPNLREGASPSHTPSRTFFHPGRRRPVLMPVQITREARRWSLPRVCLRIHPTNYVYTYHLSYSIPIPSRIALRTTYAKNDSHGNISLGSSRTLTSQRRESRHAYIYSICTCVRFAFSGFCLFLDGECNSSLLI